MKTIALGVSLALLSVSAAVAVAEEPAAPQPTAEHETLEMWIGSWSGTGEMKAGPFGPGGPMTWTEECSWFGDGRFHVVCRSEGTSPMGPAKGLGIAGYNASKGVYTYYGVDDNGWSGFAEGTRDGDSWIYLSEETMGGETYQTQYTVTEESPTELSFTWEVSQDGKTWTVLMDGTSKKK